jgi:alpha-L-rhamnosidase
MRRWMAGAAVMAAAAISIGQGARADGPAAPPAPAQLTVGDTARPLNVEGAPQFGWMPGSARGDDVQSAYEIVVSDAAGQPVWDSGKVASSDQSYVPYAGPALDNGTSYT